ncbi:complement component C7 [Mugil cephalus]|uniref:complement component C7 n=1 Tax=Mugil cephalus TaxID=48193 RepID=UPI001FB5D9B5|nr:complement component C7 [Mugil cephalus]
MKNISQLCATVLPWLFLLFITRGFCYQRVHCQWGPFGSWSECDGCTNLQTRSRAIVVYAQFGGNPCSGERTETRSCVTTKSCPLQDGCGDRFRCRSGKCISQSLVCNGDQDCEEDGLDERFCGPEQHMVCSETAPPPNIEHLGFGFDVVTGKRRGSVINTKSYGGQCRLMFSGLHRFQYRLPLSIIKYSTLVTVKNDFSDEMFSNTWEFTKDIVKREKVSGTTSGFHNYDYHKVDFKSQTQRVLILKNDIEVAQFQSNSPQYLPISEEFWKALTKLPSVYDYPAYRKVLERFGTHYLSEGSLGGAFRIVDTLDEKTVRFLETEREEYDECERTKRWILFFPLTIEKCRRGQSGGGTSRGDRVVRPATNVDVDGGAVSLIAALKRMQANDVDSNWKMYSDWAESVGSFPVVIKQKVRPLSELVKEVQCAGVKKLYLRRAIEQYRSESDPCHCQPCSNNGLAVMEGNQCKCICKPNTSGLSCETGTEAEGVPGVIHGSWSCWSSWSFCSAGRRSRSRSCSNPPPQNGGQHCFGDRTESSDCEDQELEYLRTWEPQCFDQTLSPPQTCRTPPALINGYILDPKEIYIEGSKVEYTCTEGYHLLGQPLVCTTNRTWSSSPGLCKLSKCRIRSVSPDVTVSPLKQVYDIGESVTLSCPEGRQVLGESTVICDPSLNFSPNPATIRCSEVTTKPPEIAPAGQCKLWEKSARGTCVCKMPFECSSSLELCGSSPATGKSIFLSVCKMHSLQCIGKNYVIAEDGACKWPQRNTTGCVGCHMWEMCDDQTSECRCKESADCSTPGLNVCVRVGEDETALTMSECEAGLRRCKGEKVTVVGILPCTD